MPRKNRLLDFRTSRGPTAVGLCQSDISGCAAIVNSAQQKLLFGSEQGDTGWYGTWIGMVFNITAPGNPFITTPRGVARLENISVCKRPVPIQNQFFEYLDYGIGPQPRNIACNWLQAYERNTVPIFSDLAPGNILRAYLTNAVDAGKRVLVQGLDANNEVIYSQDALVQVQGDFLDLTAPFVDSQILNSLTALQKDITYGSVKFYEVNPTTGDERLILTMEPGETTAAYRRYQIVGVPNCCCLPGASPLQVEAMAKLEYIPVAVDTDYLTPINNLEALIEECISIRYSTQDSPTAAQLSIKHHKDAIRLLNGELIHYEGKSRPAISFKPFGSASLERVNIGML